jgi:protein-disulfide isomerase
MNPLKNLTVFVLSVCALLNAAAFAAEAPKELAKVGNVVLTEDQMRKEVGMQLYQAENNVYMTQKGWIDQKAQGILFDQAAKDAGLPRQAWEAREIDGKALPPDPQQVQQMAGQFARPGMAATDTLKMASDYLTNQNKQMRRNQLYQELTQKNPVQVFLTKPEAPHIDVTYSSEDPVKGKAKAPVTIVEFTDFQCPYCKRSQDALHQLEQAYPQDVKVVARQYPLPFHDRAKPAAEAALCAKEQGKYWDYRDKLFDKQQLSDADLQRYAQELHLNEKKFNQCLAGHRYAAKIDADIADGQRFGVNGTPHFFINGVSIVGAQPYQNFQQAVQDALNKKK